ncbi:hypothetical protein P885DRAFT_25321 [Corynascus similis CBS 632.67]
MSAAATSYPPATDVYESDDGLLRDSPPLEPIRPKLQLSPSPVPTLSSSSAGSASDPGDKRSSRRRAPKPSQGDVILISTLDNHRHEAAAYTITWTSETEDAEDLEDPDIHEESMSRRDISPGEQPARTDRDRGKPTKANAKEAANPRSPSEEDIGAFDLKSLAAGALAAVTEPQQQPDAGPTPPITENDVVGERAHSTSAPGMTIHARREVPRHQEQNGPPPMPSPYSPQSMYSPRESGTTPLSSKMDMRSPTASIHSSTHSDGLPPIYNSPRHDTNGQTLPSIRSQLGDVARLAGNYAAGNGMRTPHHAFPGSPPATKPRLPSLHSQVGSPPMPLSDPYRDPLSPSHSLPPTAPSPYFYPQANGLHRQREYASNSPEAVGSHQSVSPPAGSGLDRMSIDSMAIQTVGSYVCQVPGCNAPPFQTQYLLNSHANVHSSARPHYCPVPGCPRGEGGKGFKRKNEMIRHGLVHESPGYICPFCPDRDHRYPRPDNLQRHVRVHHVDKDKDDPLLRDVLAQRPNGPSRGRRRRGAAS